MFLFQVFSGKKNTLQRHKPWKKRGRYNSNLIVHNFLRSIFDIVVILPKGRVTCKYARSQLLYIYQTSEHLLQ